MCPTEEDEENSILIDNKNIDVSYEKRKIFSRPTSDRKVKVAYHTGTIPGTQNMIKREMTA